MGCVGNGGLRRGRGGWGGAGGAGGRRRVVVGRVACEEVERGEGVRVGVEGREGRGGVQTVVVVVVLMGVVLERDQDPARG